MQNRKKNNWSKIRRANHFHRHLKYVREKHVIALDNKAFSLIAKSQFTWIGRNDAL